MPKGRPQAGGIAAPIPHVSSVQDRADRVFAKGMRRWFEQLSEHETGIRNLHRRIGEAMRAAFRRRGLRPGQARTAALRIMRRFRGDREAQVREVVAQAARAGGAERERLARAVFGDADAQRALAPSIDVAGVERRVVAMREQGEFMLDRMSIRARLRRNSAQLVDNLSRQVEASIRTGEGMRELAARIPRQNISVAIPRHIEEMAELARTAPPGQGRAAIKKHLAKLRDGRIAEHNIAQDTRRFLRKLETAEGADIDAAVEEWVERRAANHAMTVARTEGMNAHAQAYVESTQGEAWVVGYRWNLNPAHERPDVCDVMASQDLHGLGAGGYPASDVPALAHPNDLCFFTAIIDEHHFERERAQRNGEPEPPRPWETQGGVTGAAWLRSQPESIQRGILGPGRSAAFRAGGRMGARVVNADGSLNPLYHVQGRAAPGGPVRTRLRRSATSAGSLTSPPERGRSGGE